MPRKKRASGRATALQLSQGEIWEVGRRALDVSVVDLARQGERPEFVLVVQAEEHGGVVLGEVVPASTPPLALAEAVARAMREPLLGEPRRPALIRVGSQAEAEMLATLPGISGVALEIVAQLPALESCHAQVELQLGGLSSDYRTQATRAGETLSAEGLQAFFRVAQQFYREALWEAYGDEVLFEFSMQTAQGAGKTLYGIIIGELGQEFGLALYPSIEALQQFYDVSLAQLDQLTALPPSTRKKRPAAAQVQREAEAMASLLQVTTLCLTYTPQRDVPPALVQEARQLKLPMANKSAFPLVMRTGDGGMRAATAGELADMCVAISAVIDWTQRIDDVESEDEVDITLTSQMAAIAGFLPELTVHTTLRLNPCVPEEDEDEDDDDILPDLAALFESFLGEPPRGQSSSQKPAGRAPSGQKRQVTGPQPAAPIARANLVYTLDVRLTDGPIARARSRREITRRIDILGRQTLHDLHQAIFAAFERWEEHLYEFNLGQGPADRSQLYFYTGGEGNDDEEAGDPTTTTLDVLNLQVGQRFGYTFDMGDQWEHIIEVVAAAEARGKGQYPRVVKKVGKAPPQYPQDDDNT